MKGKRVAGLGILATKVAVKEIESLTAKLFLSKEQKEKKDEETQRQLAEVIFSKLSQLKGTGIKLLQALSLDEELLPKPYIEKFEMAYGKIPPLSRPVVKKVFKNEIGQSPEEVFKEFNYTALASASLGQVHEATLKSGESVVVKVQYPNVATNMETDLKLIQLIAGVIGNPLIKSSVEELAFSLFAETDYHLEAANIEYFYDLVLPEGTVLPKVYRDYSSKKVLTLSKIEGETLPDIESQELINKCLQKIFSFFFLSLKAKKCIHADPHPGNFVVSQDQTGIVDFGSVKKDIPSDVVELFLRLLDKKSSPEQIVNLYKKLGANTEKGVDHFYRDHVKEYHLLCTSIVGHEIINFSEIKSTVSKMRRSLFFQARESQLRGLSSEFTLLHKAFQSLLFMLCKYKACISTKI